MGSLNSSFSVFPLKSCAHEHTCKHIFPEYEKNIYLKCKYLTPNPARFSEFFATFINFFQCNSENLIIACIWSIAHLSQSRLKLLKNKMNYCLEFRTSEIYQKGYFKNVTWLNLFIRQFIPQIDFQNTPTLVTVIHIHK